jgi:catechol 2,3-dioxygenase-like lactoylglutathione lyase family enzyme
MKPIRLLCWLALPLMGPASSAAPPAAAASTAETRAVAGTGAFFALSVADLNASARWYSDKLGLKVVTQTPRHDKAAAVVLEGEGLIVELIHHDDAVPLGKAAPGVKSNIEVHGLVKAGVIVPDFDRTLAILKERRVDIAFGPYPARQDQRANVIIRDNEGNLIQLFGRSDGNIRSRVTSDGRPGGPA